VIEVVSVALVNWYLGANVLVVVAALLLAVIQAISLKLARPFTYRHLLQLGYAISVAAVLLPLIGGLSGRHERLFPNGAQVWFAPTMRTPILAATENQRITASLAPAGTSMSLSVAARFASCVFLSGLWMRAWRGRLATKPSSPSSCIATGCHQR
jgi:hypothetical protein